MSDKSILIITDPLIPVPPLTYGGVERIVDILVEGLKARGWSVTLACHSESSCQVKQLHHPRSTLNRSDRVANTWNILRHLASHRYDLIHSSAHFDLTAPLWPFSQKLIQTFHAPPDWRAFYKRVRLIPKRNLWFTTVGFHMTEAFASIAPTRAIHNGVRIQQFDFNPEVASDAPLVFLGRIDPIKGTHTAIKIAIATGRQLIIAGNRPTNLNLDQYFSECIEPHLSDRITYIGPVNDIQKNELLGKSAALLMPIEWDEPFGLVMAEALACGTPVIGTARGALPEIVADGVTGLGCKDVGEMIEAVRNIDSFVREACRQSAEQRFASEIIVDQYVTLYDEILGH